MEKLWAIIYSLRRNSVVINVIHSFSTVLFPRRFCVGGKLSHVEGKLSLSAAWRQAREEIQWTMVFSVRARRGGG
jgi:hypothetical protein